MTMVRADWQLPSGVPQGNWDYSESDSIATDYDEYFAGHGLLELDATILDQHLQPPGVVVDLGCGTGRSLLPLLKRGFRGIGVDLSHAMLKELQHKAAGENLDVQCVRANLVELDCLPDGCCDHAICLFSTLGMIEGSDNRLEALRHVRRVVRPGGQFVLHVHNLWSSLWRPDRGWLVTNFLRSLFSGKGRGDKRYLYRGVPGFFLHAFTRRELNRLCRQAGFKTQRVYAIAHGQTRLLKYPWLASSLRAQGWILILC